MHRESLFIKIFDKYENYIMAFILIASTMILFVVLWAVMSVLGVLSDNLLIALIGFSGSILGGGVTLFGVVIANRNTRKIEEERRKQEKVNRFIRSYYDSYSSLEKARNMAIGVLRNVVDIYPEREFAELLLGSQDELLEAFRDTQRHLDEAGPAKQLIETVRDYNRLYFMGYYNNKSSNDYRQRQESLIRAAISHVDKLLYELKEKKKEYDT